MHWNDVIKADGRAASWAHLAHVEEAQKLETASSGEPCREQAIVCVPPAIAEESRACREQSPL